MIDTKELFFGSNFNDVDSDDDAPLEIVLTSIRDNNELGAPTFSPSVPIMPVRNAHPVVANPLEDLISELTNLTRRAEDAARVRSTLEARLPRRANQLRIITVGNTRNNNFDNLGNTPTPSINLHEGPNVVNVRSYSNVLTTATSVPNFDQRFEKKKDASTSLSYIKPIKEKEEEPEEQPQFLLTEILNNLDNDTNLEPNPEREELMAMYVEDFLFAPLLGYSSAWTRDRIEPYRYFHNKNGEESKHTNKKQ